VLLKGEPQHQSYAMLLSHSTQCNWYMLVPVITFSSQVLHR
jgi:hypothetical protein